MKNIIRTTAASGIIGQFGIEWEVKRLDDIKYNSTCYDLFIQHEFVKTCTSVKEALEVLIDQFSE